MGSQRTNLGPSACKASALIPLSYCPSLEEASSNWVKRLLILTPYCLQHWKSLCRNLCPAKEEPFHWRMKLGGKVLLQTRNHSLTGLSPAPKIQQRFLSGQRHFCGRWAALKHISPKVLKVCRATKVFQASVQEGWPWQQEQAWLDCFPSQLTIFASWIPKTDPEEVKRLQGWIRFCGLTDNVPFPALAPVR